MWSRAITDAYPTVTGLLYGSSMNANEPCVALYEGAQPAMPSAPRFHRLLADPTVLSRLKSACQAVNYALL